MNTNTHALAGHRPLASPLWTHVAGLWARFAVATAQARLRRRGAAELMAMNERELRDLGIGRGEVGHALQNGRA